MAEVSLVHDAATILLRVPPPELAHAAALAGLSAGLGPRERANPDPALAANLAGLPLPNPIGLAAGFDKNGRVAGPVLRAGFGFVECGTVTPLAQAGNLRPRLFRLTEERALINRLGFNNDGLEAFATHLSAQRGPGIVGANVGANKDSTDRIADYVTGLERLWPLADYFTVNVSSPNTPGLRALQSGQALHELLGRVAETRDRLAVDGAAKPIFLKIAPDLDEAAIAAVAEAAVAHRLSGLVISNTTTGRPAGLRGRHAGEAGGLSGAPLMGPSTLALRTAFAIAGRRLTLVGVGGIASGADAYAKIRAGASAVQLYTALIFAGPGLIGRIKRELAERLKADGFARLADAVGAG
jgi:dihydroorotate dehydrogenase